MWNSDHYYERLLDGWERSETAEGIPYYINHNAERTQWDHPLLVKTMEELVDMDNIRYAAYRTAMKLRFIQKRLRLDLVELATVEGVFERHGFPGSRDSFIDAPGLYNILLDIFVLTRNTDVTRRIDKEQSSELLLNWILNLYDVKRNGSIRVLSVKVGLAALCSARLTEKYRFMFKQLRDHTNQISRRKLTTFLHDVMQIAEQIKESAPFGGTNVLPAVASCFQQSWDSTGIAEDVFVTWLLMEPQTIVWLPTIHRMAAAESVKHESKCNICKTFPIIGFRYKCLKCFNFDMCQQCFFTGRISKKHKLKHPTQEYCVETTSKDDTKAFVKTIRNNLSRKHRNKVKLRYLPIHGTSQPNSNRDKYDELGSPDTHSSTQKIVDKLEEADDSSPQSSKSADLPKYKPSPIMTHSPKTTPEHLSPRQFGNFDDDNNMFEKSGIYLAGPDRREMESIMLHLERENRELLHEIETLRYRQLEQYDSESEASDREWLKDEKERLEVEQEILESHNRQLEYQLQRLRLLIGQDHYSSTRSPLGPVNTNIPDDSSPTTAHKRLNVPSDDAVGYTTPRKLSTKQQNYTPRHPQSPPAYTPSGDQQDRTNESFFSNSLLMPVPQSAAYKRREISPIRPDSENSNSNTAQRKDLNARKSLNSTAGLSQLEIDITYGSMDPTLGQTHFTLPDVNNSVDYDDDEAEMDELIDKLDKVYPVDMSHSMLLANKTTMENMYKAAGGIGDVMVDIASPSPAYMSADISDILACDNTVDVSNANYTDNREMTLDNVEGAIGISKA